ncbi:MAG TPA: GNAT family N-acetyltransferase [Candidatus Cybelea sp.]|nr:GNAT family N-acetyltransferase [Candidatus Cybelea sp.]
MSAGANESTVAIRSPERRDYSRMADLAGQLGYESTGEGIATRLAEIENMREYAIFVAELPDGEIAGWVSVFVYRTVTADARAEISGLIVDARARSLGIGRRLLERAEEWARQKGCSAVGLRSNVTREQAHNFYERCGYRVNKTQKSFRKSL